MYSSDLWCFEASNLGLTNLRAWDSGTMPTATHELTKEDLRWAQNSQALAIFCFNSSTVASPATSMTSRLASPRLEGFSTVIFIANRGEKGAERL
jgi:hypothetical protein